MTLNPLAYTEKVLRGFLRYQVTTHAFADERFDRRLKHLLSLDTARETPLLRGPYVSLSRAFRSGAAIDDLVSEGLLHPHMKQLVPFDAVYGHQEEAIRAITGGRTTLISTGTGSGKSECFLYPVISRCLELRDRKAEPGILAVLVYPMNALAEDQLGRLRDLLAGTGIRFGMYVGKTPEREADVSGRRLPAGASRADYRAAVAEVRKTGQGVSVHPGEEVCSREAMRTPGQQPRILLTNVNQLELLLTRQSDVELFDRARLDYLVFDEAHTFTGARGAEAACLIRRLRSFCGRGEEETVCVATSATIVDQGAPDAARQFASRFFGVAAGRVATVHEAYEREVWASDRRLPSAPADPGAALKRVLSALDADDDGASLRREVRELTGEELPEGEAAAALHAALSRNELLHRASDLLETPRALGNLLEELLEAVGREVTEEELVIWLTLGAAARTDGRPLVRPVVHAFLRGIPRAVATFDGRGEPELFLSAEDAPGADDQEPVFRPPVFTCTTCGQHYFEHHLEDFEFAGPAPGGGRAESERRYWEAKDPALGGVRLLLVDRLVSEAADDAEEETTQLSPIHLCRRCGAAHGDPATPCLSCGASETLLTLRAAKQKEERPGLLASCLCCKSPGGYYGGRYREPIKPTRAVNVADVHVLAQEMVQHAERKRLLVFADNRQDAAFQAGWMRDHARRYRLRALMFEALAGGELSIIDLASELARTLDEADNLSRALIPEVWVKAAKDAAGKEHRRERAYLLRILVLRELTAALKQRIGLEPWGRIKVRYVGLSESSAFFERWAHRLGLPPSELVEGVAALLDAVRRSWNLVLDRNGHIFSRTWAEGHDEVMSGYLPLLRGVPQGIKFTRDANDDKGRIHQLVSPTGHRTLMVEVASKWGVPSEETETFLEELWELLTGTQPGLLVPVTLTGWRRKALPNTAGAHQIDGDKLMIQRQRGLYRCGACQRRSVRKGPRGHCLAWHCTGTLQWVPEDPDDYDLNVLDEDYTMVRPREHTAMVPNDEREEIEQLFKGSSDALNALVCTQTLELGVDIGALDAVLLRNVPPLPANYWQRAGRAGRRHRMAVNLTYCRPVSHDRAYFAEPLKMLGGRVDPPAFNLSNREMVAKHVHAAVLTRLHQMARDDGGLSAHDRTEVRRALAVAFPHRIRDYLFDEDGSVRSTPRDVRILHTVVTRHLAAIRDTVRSAFEQGWPVEDREVVEPARLDGLVDRMTDELEGVVRRLFRRLQWALDQMAALGLEERRKGSLDPELRAFRHRCERLVDRYKGISRRARSEAEGYDDTITYSVLAAEGFLPGYGLESGSVLGMAEVPRSFRGGRDFDLPRAPAVALREYVPGNLIYANGHKFVARRFAFEAGERQRPVRFEVFPEHEAVRPVESGAAGALGAQLLTSVPVCDVTLVHTDRISDEEENRFQMAVEIYGREQGEHEGGKAWDWGGRSLHLLRGLRLQLVNVGSRAAVLGAGQVGYPVCRTCGQSVSPFSSERQRADFEEKHKEWCHQRPERVGFHADLTADALVLSGNVDRIDAYSLTEGLRFAAASVMDMDLEDLQVLVLGHPEHDELTAILYDPMPGGSGLLQHMLGRWREIVAEARRMARDCPSLCGTSCIDCFRTYRNAFYHAHLDRHRLLELLDRLGETLEEAHSIPPKKPAGPGPGGDAIGPAERKLKAMLKAAGFPAPSWQESFPLPKPLGSTTPDATYRDPDDPELRLHIYLDGLSRHIHGNPRTAERDKQIRAELRAEGNTVLEISAHDLDDKKAMVRFFKRLGRFLEGREEAQRVADEADDWFEARESTEEGGA